MGRVRWVLLAVACSFASAGAASAAIEYDVTTTLGSSGPPGGFYVYHLPISNGQSYLLTINSDAALTEVTARDELYWDIDTWDENGVFHYEQSNAYTLDYPFNVVLDGDTYSGQFLSHQEFMTFWPNGQVHQIKWHRAQWIDINISFDPADADKTITWSLTAVPEPATWAMMIAGFGLAGAAMRRRRRLVGQG